MTDETPPPAAPREDLPEPVSRRRSFSASLIWLVPALAALVGAWLVIRSTLAAGPTITISFQTAEGLEAGKTSVKYKDVVIGIVHEIRLSGDRKHVLVTVNLQKSAENFATADSRFWVVRPRIDLNGVSGVDTLLSGPFIGADVGDSDEEKRDFVGLETPPSVIHGTPGKSFRLHGRDLSSLDVGSPVYYRRIQVGRVTSYQLDADGKGVSIYVFIDGPNDQFVTRSTRFWNASGVDFSLGANGLKVNTQSLATVIAGGIAFADPPGPHDSTPAQADSQYELFGAMAAAMLPPDGEPTYVRMRFDQSLRGLSVDAPVEFFGVDVGRVVSMTLDYDEKTQHFAVFVGAVIYRQRLGRAHTKLAEISARRGNGDDTGATMAGLVAHGLRAEARSGNLLTGQLYISIDFVRNAPKVAFNPLAKPLEIPTSAGRLSELQERVESIVAKFDRIPFDQMAAHLDESVKGLNTTLKQLNGDVLPQFKGTLLSANKTLNNASEALSAGSPLQQNLGLTLDELRRTARSVRVFSDYLSRHPEALILGRRADAEPVADPVPTGPEPVPSAAPAPIASPAPVVVPRSGSNP
jgi:paraquat-inducible protein B